MLFDYKYIYQTLQLILLNQLYPLIEFYHSKPSLSRLFLKVLFLFSDTIAKNIQFGLKEEIENSDELMIQASRDAAIYNNIVEFKEGFETIVGE